MEAKAEFMSQVNDLYKFQAIQGHLGWDQETIMPAKGAKARGEILAWLASQRHEKLINPNFGKVISELESQELDQFLAANVKEMRRKYDEAVKIPTEFVAEFTKTRSEALIAWQQARKESNFSLFSSHLEKLISLTRKKIEYLGCEDTPYDVLLDEYEVGMKVSDYDPLFAELKDRLVPLLSKIMESNISIPSLPESLNFAEKKQQRFCNEVSKAMGFDFDAGRMDISTHPFCAGLWPGDTRFTTRFDEKDPFSCLYACLLYTSDAADE